MSNELTLALIASGTSVLVAIISLIVSVWNSRQTARSSKEIEKLKHHYSRASTLAALSDSQWGESLKALQLAIKSIQRVKDEIQVVLSATETPTETKPLIEGIRAAREQIFACYEEQMATLENEDARIVHKAKNTSLQAEALIKRRLPTDTEVTTLPKELGEQLQTIRMNLTELQQSLRDSKTDTLMKKLQGVEPAEKSKVIESGLKRNEMAEKLSDSLEGLRLLVVDDQAAVPELLSLLMSQYGVDVRGAKSAVEALDLVIRWKPQVLVSDVMMPDEDGYWLIKQVRSLKSQQKEIIAIAVTGGGWEADERRRILSSGFNECIAKPLNPDEFINVIKSSLLKGQE